MNEVLGFLRGALTHDGVMTLLVAGMYFWAILFVRVRFMAAPYRNGLRARRQALLDGSQDLKVDGITKLLQEVDNELGPNPGLWWSSGDDHGALLKIQTAERELVKYLDSEQVLAYALGVSERLAHSFSGKHVHLSGRINAAASYQPGTEQLLDHEALTPERLSRLRALAIEGLRVLHSGAAEHSGALLALHRKTAVLAGTATLVIVSLALFLEQAELLLAGALGAITSRLIGIVRSRDVPDDYGNYWTTIVLAPLTGALSAYGGILLIAVLDTAGILGDTFTTVAWTTPRQAPTLGAAFVLGFSERLLDRLARRADGTSQDAVPAPSPPDPPELPSQNDARGTEDNGDNGDTSDTEDSGDGGDTGATGATGNAGDTEDTGDTGATSDTEDSGDNGDTSDTSDTEDSGDDGDAGATSDAEDTRDRT